jgi:uncharacterized membrane protein YgdD (TMEM256/DUF423 family)
MERSFAAFGGVLCAFGVGLSAYAAHGVDGDMRRLSIAAAFAFGHGVALAALASHAAHRLGAIALAMVSAGVVLFAGSLVAAALWRWPTTLAPTGGLLLIAGWLLFAVHSLRR